MENINNSYFDGYYKDIWRSIIPTELTVKEVDFMQQYFGIRPDFKVLDLMCGFGRHSVALAQKGSDVIAVDNLMEYIEEIQKISLTEHLKIEAIRADVMKFKVDKIFDLVICMGNSFCFFNKEESLKLLTKIAAHLKPGGHFLINSWMLAEIVFNGFREKSWNDIGEYKYITSSKYFIQPSRIESQHLILAPGGIMEEKKAIDFIYSIAETEQLLNESGFTMKEVYSIPGRKKFTLGDPRAYIIAEKN